MQSNSQPICAIVGAGPGNGYALARKFVAAGYRVAILARNRERLAEFATAIAGVYAFECDVTDVQSISAAFAAIKSDLGQVDSLIYNAGKGVWGDALSVSPQDFESAWRINTFGGFLCAQQVLPEMISAGHGSIVFMGATASRRGVAKTVAFAAAKGGQRLMAESLARAYGPLGIHVSLMIIDAVVGEPLMRSKLADRPDDFFCAPDDIADTAVMLTSQKCSAWTFELEVRPFAEKW
jgi:NAD(P)-dependent dehydrogenase (short-subunit alcohol dehydrogenase family)